MFRQKPGSAEGVAAWEDARAAAAPGATPAEIEDAALDRVRSADGKGRIARAAIVCEAARAGRRYDISRREHRELHTHVVGMALLGDGSGLPVLAEAGWLVLESAATAVKLARARPEDVPSANLLRMARLLEARNSAMLLPFAYVLEVLADAREPDLGAWFAERAAGLDLAACAPWLICEVADTTGLLTGLGALTCRAGSYLGIIHMFRSGLRRGRQTERSRARWCAGLAVALASGANQSSQADRDLDYSLYDAPDRLIDDLLDDGAGPDEVQRAMREYAREHPPAREQLEQRELEDLRYALIGVRAYPKLARPLVDAVGRERLEAAGATAAELSEWLRGSLVKPARSYK